MSPNPLSAVRFRSNWWTWVLTAAVLLAPVESGNAALWAGPNVVFDFAPVAQCRDVTPDEQLEHYPYDRLLEVTLPVSVRFHGVAPDDVFELDIEIDGAAAGLRVIDFAPATQLTSDVADAIETVTTTKRDQSLDATLGGAIPVPYGELVAQVAPSLSAGASRTHVATEKMNRLPPKHAVVISGTSNRGRGVFFKLKRSSQTSLEGVHELTVVFAAPAEWSGGDLRVACTARGRRQMFWIKQSGTLGRAAGRVQLNPPIEAEQRDFAVRHAVAKPTADE